MPIDMRLGIILSGLSLLVLGFACGGDDAGSGGQGGTATTTSSTGGAGGMSDGGGGGMPGGGGSAPMCADDDLDGYGEGDACLGPDCNEMDAAIHSGALERCDMIDNDCDDDADAGIGDLSVPDNMGAPDIFSLHLFAPDTLFGSGPITVGDVLTALRDMATSAQPTTAEQLFGATAGSAPGLDGPDVCPMATELVYLLDAFPQAMTGILDVVIAPGEKAFIDQFGFNFVTNEPDMFTPLPFGNEEDLTFYAGEGTGLTSTPVLQLELVVRGVKLTLSAHGD